MRGEWLLVSALVASTPSTWRIGSVPHLNARPLVYGLDGVQFCPPAALADALHRQELDVALVPVAEVLRHDQYDIVDGIGVVSHGPVRSVFLAHRVPIATIKRVAVDPNSRSSAALVRVVLECRYGLAPEYYPRPVGETLAQHDAMLVFGDEAVNVAGKEGYWPALDLGEEWSDWTGLPFVYAVWAAQRGVADAGALAERLRAAKVDGLANLEEVILTSTEGTEGRRRDYLTRCIRWDLGAAEKQGIAQFQQYLQELKLVTPHELRFIN
jgi:chorismate dehydratase